MLEQERRALLLEHAAQSVGDAVRELGRGQRGRGRVLVPARRRGVGEQGERGQPVAAPAAAAGLVTANITARYTMICNQPFAVIF